MDWTEIKVSVNAKNVGTASDIAHMTVPYGIYIEDYSNLEQEAFEIAHVDLIDEELLQKNRDIAIIHIYIKPDENPMEAISFLQERLSIAGIENSIETENCAEEDWINNWKKYFKPIPVGKKILIRPSWIDDYDSEGRAVLSIEPGLAFGTGTHATTRLCLETMEKCDLTGKNVLDLGCGSGILSIGALLLGAESVVAVDIDEVASRIASENLENNGFNSERATVLCGNALEDEALVKTIGEGYDVICANIVAGIIIEMSPLFMSVLKNGGYLIASGIISERENEVRLALEKIGFKVVETASEDDWSVILAQKI